MWRLKKVGVSPEEDLKIWDISFNTAMLNINK